MLSTPLLADQGIEGIDLNPDDSPSGYTCYDEREIERLASHVKKCELCNKNISSVNEQYLTCKKLNSFDEYADIKMWAGILGGAMLGFALGRAN